MRRAATVFSCAVLLVGCGGGGSGDDQPRDAAAATATPTPVPTSPSRPATSAPPAEARAITRVLGRYAAAVRAGDARTICRRLLADAVVQRVEEAGGSCEENLVGPSIQEAGPGYRIAIRGLTVEGDRARAEIVASEQDGARTSVQPLARERGRWRLAAR